MSGMERPNPIEKSGFKEEINEADFEASTQRGIVKALVLLSDRFENNENPKENLPFHNSGHTRSVIDRTERILQTIQGVSPDLISNHDIALAKLGAAYHDTVQAWEENEDGKRVRHIEENEFDSRKEAYDFMYEANAKASEKLFTPDDISKIGRAMYATIPGFDIEKNTVIQPGLVANSPLESQAVALADLGTAGMDGAEDYHREGDALFREENLDILDAIEKERAQGGSISGEKKEEYRSRMLGWSKFQPAFAEGRKNLLDKELLGIPEEAREEVKNLFDKFDETITASNETAQKRGSMSFEEIFSDMGYEPLDEYPDQAMAA